VPAPHTIKEQPMTSAQPTTSERLSAFLSLTDLPISDYTLTCKHTGNDYAVAKGDVLFCEPCASLRTVRNVTVR